MLKKEIRNNRIKYSLTELSWSLIKAVFVVFITVCAVVSLSLSSVVEAKTTIPVVNFSMSSDEVRAAKEQSAELVDIIMTADDFLDDGERAADYEDIHEYLNELRLNGINVNRDSAVSLDKIENIEQQEDEEQDADNNQEENSYDVAEVQEINDDSEIIEEVCEKNVDLDDWRLILVNKQNPVPDGYESNLASINGSLQADERIIDDVYDMLDAAKADGVDLMICSAYRSYDRQTVLFNNKMNKLMHKGMSYMEAYAVGSMSVTVPGTSEHQLGLALDILTGSYTAMDDGFGDTAAGIWLRENAPNYGFILRYPEGKEEITGIIYEPWHFRYVGKEYASEITELSVCLEEYLNGEY